MYYSYELKAFGVNCELAQVRDAVCFPKQHLPKSTESSAGVRWGEAGWFYPWRKSAEASSEEKDLAPAASANVALTLSRAPRGWFAYLAGSEHRPRTPPFYFL